MIIDELNAKIDNMYTISEYNEMRDKLKKEIDAKQSDYNHIKMCLDATQIQLATYKGMVDIFERFTDTKEFYHDNQK